MAKKTKKKAKKTTKKSAKKATTKDPSRKAKAGKSSEPRARVRFRSPLSKEDAVTQLEAIVKGIKKGTIRIKQGRDSVTLSPPPFVDVTVRARSRDSRERVSIALSWRVPSRINIS